MWWATAAWAAEASRQAFRVGIFVGNNAGDPGEDRLRFATTDAAKLRDTFVDVGGVRPGDAVLLLDAGRQAVGNAFQQLHSRLVEARNAGLPTSFVFTYSGHGDVDGLHLGGTVLSHEELRSLLDDSGADVRIAVLDACRSGAALRAKGGARGPNFDLRVEAEAARGTAILTSSAASELSQESAEVGGGFFTHVLTGALLGAADVDRSGEVTLPEAYAWVHAQTAAVTRSAPEAQTPSFDFDLVGAGDVVLTTLEAASSHLSFLGDLEGALAVWDEDRRRYVAEVAGNEVVTLALRPGSYAVHRRQPAWMDEALYDVRRGETLSVLDEDFQSVPYEETVSRGDIERIARHARRPDLALGASLGVRSFGETEVGLAYVPTHAVLGVVGRLLPPGTTWVGFDLMTGAGPATLDLGDATAVDAFVSTTSVGGSAGFATRPNLFRVGAGGRAELMWVRRAFPDEALPDQASLGVAPGVATFAGVQVGRFVAELDWNLMMLAVRWDDQGFPLYGEFALMAGARL
jgi:hypothetical protein